MADRDARIRERAYQLWEDEGRPEGRMYEHWGEAERQIAQEDATITAPAQPDEVPPASAPEEPAPMSGAEPALAAKPRRASRPKTAAERPVKRASSAKTTAPSKESLT